MPALQALANWHLQLASHWPTVTARRYVRQEVARCTIMESYEWDLPGPTNCEAWLIEHGQRVSEPWRQGERVLERFAEHKA